MLLPQISKPLALNNLSISRLLAKRRQSQALRLKTIQSRFGSCPKTSRQLLKQKAEIFMEFITVLGQILFKVANKNCLVFRHLDGSLVPMFKMFHGEAIRNWLVSFP